MRSIEIFPDGKSSFRNPEKIILDERDSTLWINSVFGVNREGRLPARFLSGFLSTFGLSEMIQEKTRGRAKPTVRIFIPSNIGMFVNGIEPHVAQKQIEQGTVLIENLVKNHFSTVSVFFEQDQPITEAALQTLENVADLAINHSESDQLLSGIQESGRRRGGEIGKEKALLYASHHPFGWNDLHHVAIFEKQPPFTVINTLPPSEKRFAQIRQNIKEHIAELEHANLLCSGKRFDLIMMMCNQPHYLLIADKLGSSLEPTLDDLLSGSCGDILEFMDARWKEESTPWLKDNLRRAKRDFERLLTKLGVNKTQDFNKMEFNDILNR